MVLTPSDPDPFMPVGVTGLDQGYCHVPDPMVSKHKPGSLAVAALGETYGVSEGT
ncbi:MAG TPA: hypothetical protein VLI04_20160 [Nocardioidaceae bacterium]|nr:hypothetical protein [Nocardioidaceae bacterium]